MTKTTKKIIVNTLTASRILGAFLIPLIFMSLNTTYLIVLLAVLFLTDFLDGKLSRLWNVQTVGGSLLDPLGDKLLAISCIFALLRSHRSFYLLLAFELIICSINLYRIFHEIPTGSLLIGKIKTWILSVTLIVGAAHLFNPDIIMDILSKFNKSSFDIIISDNMVLFCMFVSSIFEILTIISYIADTLKVKNKNEMRKSDLLDIRSVIKILFDEERYQKDKDKTLLEIIKK